MFSKPTKPAPTPTAAKPGAPAPSAPPPAPAEPPRKPRVASLISNDITVEGGITGDGELQIDGVVRGDVKVGRLTVGETGHVEGSVFAEVSEVRGRVVGSVTAKQVRLYGTAYVDGDITHEQLAMETGAFFQGRSLKFQRPAPAPQPAPAPAPQHPSTVNVAAPPPAPPRPPEH
jgi:cytoskeletal protein CcmA (bactofilin family)